MRQFLRTSRISRLRRRVGNSPRDDWARRCVVAGGDVETVARTWRATREATRVRTPSGPPRSRRWRRRRRRGRLQSRVVRSGREGEDEAAETVRLSRLSRLPSCRDCRDARITETKTTHHDVVVVRYRDRSRSPDDAPAPPGVAAALATRGGSVAANSSNVDDVESSRPRTPRRGWSRRRTMAKRMVAEPRFGSRLLASKSVANAETCAEAAARLRVTLTESEALLHTQRARAVDALRREITRAFSNENGRRDAGACGGSRVVAVVGRGFFLEFLSGGGLCTSSAINAHRQTAVCAHSSRDEVRFSQRISSVERPRGFARPRRAVSHCVPRVSRLASRRVDAGSRVDAREDSGRARESP